MQALRFKAANVGLGALVLSFGWVVGCDQEAHSPGGSETSRAGRAEVGEFISASSDEATSTSSAVVTSAPTPGRMDASGPSTTSPATDRSVEPQERAGYEVPSFEPLADAKAGEWARFVALESYEILYEVMHAGMVSVDVQVTVLMNGRPLGLPAGREELRDYDPVATFTRGRRAERASHAAVIEAAGRSWDVTVYEEQWTDEGVRYLRRTWVSPAAPVFGMVRMEQYGDNDLEARLELTGFGGPTAERRRED
ncbi:MAG: hypothetical protein GXY55_18710 [Phycisphaerae bacterium]|nr:hypothetical protein [Phycisphaerae bacterium]